MENLVLKMQSGEIKADPALVISNVDRVKALERAYSLGVPYVAIESKGRSREAFEADLITAIDAKQPDYIVLAGFMRILTKEFVQRYKGKLINIHPSLLPSFPGAHGIRDAFEAKAKEAGVTVHFVDEGVDTGKIICREKVPIFENDTLETLEERVHAAEYEVFPVALKLVLDGRAKME